MGSNAGSGALAGLLVGATPAVLGAILEAIPHSPEGDIGYHEAGLYLSLLTAPACALLGAAIGATQKSEKFAEVELPDRRAKVGLALGRGPRGGGAIRLAVSW